MKLVLRAVVLRNQPSQRLPHQLLYCVTQHTVHCAVRQRNLAGTVDHNHGVRENVKKIRDRAEAGVHVVNYLTTEHKVCRYRCPGRG